MLGISFYELIIIAIVAIVALGPEKLPKAMVELAKYIKIIRKTINDAKSSFESELNIAELKNEINSIKSDISDTAQSVRKKMTFEELDELKSTKNELKSAFDEINSSLKDVTNLSANSANSNSQNPAQNEQESKNDEKKD